MVFNSCALIRAMDATADICQYAARIHHQDRLPSHQLLDLLCCLPLHHVGRFLLCFWTYLCVSAPDSYYYSSSSDDDDDDAGDGDGGGGSSATADYVDIDYTSQSD